MFPGLKRTINKGGREREGKRGGEGETERGRGRGGGGREGEAERRYLLRIPVERTIYEDLVSMHL